MQKKIPFADKYDGLELSDEFIRIATYHPETLKYYCNGVGSQVGTLGKLTYHLIPNTIWFLDITPAADIHDIDYVFPTHFNSEGEAIEHKKQADRRFYNNVKTLIDRNTKSSLLKYLRYKRLRKYYWALKELGYESFLEGKEIGKTYK
jgi:hypothetical protein